jgi:hypothetical protein
MIQRKQPTSKTIFSTETGPTIVLVVKKCEKENEAPNVDSCGEDDDLSSDDECPSGFFLQSMNEDIEWTFKIHEHAKTCRGAFSPVVHTKKKGWGKIA